MYRELVARVWFGALAALVVSALVVQTWLSAGDETGYFTTPAGRVFNVYCFFTVQSNVLVVVVCTWLARRGLRLTPLLRALQVSALVAIVITGVIFHTALSDLRELEGGAAYVNTVVHTVSPLAFPIGWLLFGPAGERSLRVVLGAAAFPLAWVVFTLVRGPIVDWYPYPFIDVATEGYATVARNLVGVAAFFVVLVALVLAVDGRWRGRRAPA